MEVVPAALLVISRTAERFASSTVPASPQRSVQGGHLYSAHPLGRVRAGRFELPLHRTYYCTAPPNWVLQRTPGTG